jgi:hypothetical protein
MAGARAPRDGWAEPESLASASREIELITRTFRRLLVLGAVLAGLTAHPAFASAATPNPVQAFYIYGTSLAGVEGNANGDACRFATTQPDTQTAIMLLDFGAARNFGSTSFGSLDFSGTLFSNYDIEQALQAAADGYHACHVRGGAIIEYGNSNYELSNSGMSTTDAWNAGHDQMAQAEILANYQVDHGYTSQGAGAASDMEPSYDAPLITKQLVNGASAQGWAIYDDYGSVDGCPTSGSSNGPCNNGWSVADVGYVSFHGMALPLPEIYYAVSASQWTVVKKWWDATHPNEHYFFDGVTGTSPAPSGGVSAGSGWNTLNAKNPGLVGPNLVCYGSGC